MEAKDDNALPVDAFPIEPEPLAAIDVKIKPLKIEANFGEIEEQIDKFIEFYGNIVIDIDDDAQVKAAKDTRASFNRLADAIKRKRIDTDAAVKKFMAPFDDKCNELEKRVRDGSMLIKRQIDEATRKFRDARRAMLEAHYAEFAGELAELVPYERVHDEKWLNRRPMTDAKAKGELENKVTWLVQAREKLAKQDLKYWSDADRVLCQTFSLSAALEENARLIEADERRRQHEEAAAHLSASTLGAAPAPVTHVEPADVISEPKVGEEVKSWSINFEGTRSQAECVATYLRKIGLHGAIIRSVK